MNFIELLIRRNVIILRHDNTFIVYFVLKPTDGNNYSIQGCKFAPKGALINLILPHRPLPSLSSILFHSAFSPHFLHLVCFICHFLIAFTDNMFAFCLTIVNKMTTLTLS